MDGTNGVQRKRKKTRPPEGGSAKYSRVTVLSSDSPNVSNLHSFDTSPPARRCGITHQRRALELWSTPPGDFIRALTRLKHS